MISHQAMAQLWLVCCSGTPGAARLRVLPAGSGSMMMGASGGEKPGEPLAVAIPLLPGQHLDNLSAQVGGGACTLPASAARAHLQAVKGQGHGALAELSAAGACPAPHPTRPALLHR